MGNPGRMGLGNEIGLSWTERIVLGSRRFNLALIANGPFQSTCEAEIRAVVGDVLYLIYQNDVIKVPLGESYRFCSGVYQGYCPEYTSISLVSL